MKAEFDKLVVQMNLEMKDLLIDKDDSVHIESFKKIEDVVYKKKNWEDSSVFDEFYFVELTGFTLRNISINK
jgi:hypothetical protein